MLILRPLRGDLCSSTLEDLVLRADRGVVIGDCEEGISRVLVLAGVMGGGGISSWEAAVDCDDGINLLGDLVMSAFSARSLLMRGTDESFL